MHSQPAPLLTVDALRSRVDRQIGARVLARRRTIGLTQQQLARLLGVTWERAHRYEKGLSRIPVDRLERLARILAVDPPYFYQCEED